MSDHDDLISRLRQWSGRNYGEGWLHLADEAAAAIAALVAERDEALRHVEQLKDKLDPKHSCACCYDRPDVVCGHHSPMLAKAEAERDAARALLREAGEHITRLRWFVETDRERSDEMERLSDRIETQLAEKEGTT